MIDEISLKPEDLLRIAMGDKQFTRFLKERNKLWGYIKLMRDDRFTNYRKTTTTDDKYKHEFLADRKYIFHGFPISEHDCTIEWQKELRDWDVEKKKNDK